MPRRSNKDGAKKRSGERAPRPERSGSGGRRTPGRVVDEEAFELRKRGASFSNIARRLELPRAINAHQAFLRALRTREGEELQGLVAAEGARLDKLEERIRERDAEEPEKIERRLKAVAVLRSGLP